MIMRIGGLRRGTLDVEFDPRLHFEAHNQTSRDHSADATGRGYAGMIAVINPII